jgi:hypothetical protein
MTKKNKMLAGTLFGLPLGAIAGIWVGFTVNVWAGLTAFAVLFVLSGWGFLTLAIKTAGKQQNRYLELKKEIAETSDLKLDGLANHERGGKLYQGRLFLTGEKLIFAGKQKGGEEKQFQLPLSEIVLAARYKPSQYVDTGLKIHRQDGSVYSFIVEDSEEWIAQIPVSGKVKTSDPIPPDSDPSR